ncbi:MAG: hypothetical protein AAF919_13535 [Pseudomonadota bacterium]
MSQARLVQTLVPSGLSKAVTQFAVRAIPGLRSSKSESPVIPFPGGAGPRGSGSWANEWEGLPDLAPQPPAKTIVKPKRQTQATPGAKPGTVRPRPLMNHADMRLHDWIADHLEIEAPACTLHAGVALSAFLSADTHEELGMMAGLTADFVIADAHGHPVVAMIREDPEDPERHSMTLDVLIDAFIPVIDMDPKPVLSELWSDISEALPRD